MSDAQIQPVAAPAGTPAAPTQIPPTRVEVDPKSTQAQPAATTPPAKPEDRPGWLPQKFKSAEDLAKAYGELEKRMGSKQPEAKPAEPTADPQATKPEDLQIKALEQQAESKGIELKAYEDEFATDGKLSEKSYAALAKSGLPKDVVDTYINGRVALGEQAVDAMTKDIGGREGYAKLSQWAASNVPQAELDAYNKIVTGSDPAAAKLALAGLHSKFKSAQEPGFFRSGEAPDVRGDVFRSTAELTKAMNDPRYRSDPAYRDDIAQKLARSNIL